MSDNDNPGIFDVFGEPPEVDPNRFGPVPVVPGSEQGEAPSGGMPHWTAPATGQVPPVLAAEGDGEVWSDLSGPRWRGEGSGWADDDLQVVFGDEKAVEHEDLMHFEAPRPSPNRPAPGTQDGPAQGVMSGEPQIIPDPPNPSPVGAAPRVQRPQQAGPAPQQGQPQPAPASAKKTRAPKAAKAPKEAGAGRNLNQAIIVGVGLAVVAAAALLIHPLAGLGLICVAALVGTVEFYDALRRVGHNPATLLGIAGAVLLPAAAYWRGESAYSVVLALTVVFGAIWYIVGADTVAPARNLGLTMLGIMWVGGLAGFGAMTLTLENGQQILLGAILLTVAYDTAAYFVGRALGGSLFGDRVFHEASPNKSWEGTIGGIVAAMVVGAVMGFLTDYDLQLWHVVALGALVAVLSVLGDLFESLLKRDMGIKDMSSLLPGHGGILDRVDSLLFVLPGVYFLARLLDYV